VKHPVIGRLVRAHPEGADDTRPIRSTLAVLSDASMEALWERSADGHTWEPWMLISFGRLY
jgi:hypothetical protein